MTNTMRFFAAMATPRCRGSWAIGPALALLLGMSACDDGETGDTPTGSESTTPSGSETNTDTETTDDNPERQSYFPLISGASWTYDVKEAGATSTKVVGLQSDPNVAGGFRYDDINSGENAPLTVPQDSTGTTTTGTTTTGTGNDGGAELSSSVLVRKGTQVLRIHQDVKVGDKITESVDYIPGFTRVDDAWAQAAAGTNVELSYDRKSITAGKTEKRSHVYTVIDTAEQVTVPAGTFTALHVQRFKLDGAMRKDETHFWFAKGVGKVREENKGNGKIEELTTYSLPASH